MYQVLVLADDLSGALEVGAKFAATGLKAIVTTIPVIPTENAKESPVLVIDTETRHLAPDLAYARVFEVSHAAFKRGIPYIYKKTDSTLRGNIASEIRAVMDAYQDLPLLYVPAYPAMRRTVCDGTLYVEGIPVNQTSFANDPLNPVQVGNVGRLLVEGGLPSIYCVTRYDLEISHAPAVYVYDATTESELRLAASKFVTSSSLKLAAGTAGFAAHLAKLLELPRGVSPNMPRVRTGLVVNGSANDVSLQQIRYAIENGFGCIDLNGIEAKPTGCDWVVLNSSIEANDPSAYVRKISQAVLKIINKVNYDALVTFGGDTTRAILEQLHRSDLLPIGEVAEGVPVSVLGPDSKRVKCGGPFYLISKAGGFGPIDLLGQIRKELAGG